MRLATLISAAAVALAGATVALAATPTVRIVHSKPFVVAGKSFAPNERVVVTLWSTRRLVRSVMSSDAGAFTVSFGTVTFGHCTGFSLTAVGSKGDRFVLKTPRPACMPQRNP
jgi:hypothetical protein